MQLTHSPYPLIIQRYQQQREQGLRPLAAFNDVAALAFTAGNPATAPALRPVLSEAEMSVVSGRPVVLINTDNLPHNHLGNANYMTAMQAEERNDILLEQLEERGIELDQAILLEERKESVSPYCARLKIPSTPSELLNELAAVSPQSVNLPASMLSGSQSRAGWHLISIPPEGWSPAEVWRDHLCHAGRLAEHVPDNADQRLLLQLHELGHARQHIPNKQPLEKRHADERGADRFAYKSYADMGGHKGVIEADLSGWVLTSFLESPQMLTCHLTAPALCAGPDMDSVFGAKASRKLYKGLNAKLNRHLGKPAGYEKSRKLPDLKRRLRGLQAMWNMGTPLSTHELFIAGLTLEAAQIYMPKLMARGLTT